MSRYRAALSLPGMRYGEERPLPDNEATEKRVRNGQLIALDGPFVGLVERPGTVKAARPTDRPAPNVVLDDDDEDDEDPKPKAPAKGTVKSRKSGGRRRRPAAAGEPEPQESELEAPAEDGPEPTATTLTVEDDETERIIPADAPQPAGPSGGGFMSPSWNA